jgi:hypothetical protein
MEATMHPTLSDDDQLRRARKRAGAKFGLLIHTVVFLSVNVGLAALALSQGRQWFVWPLLGWGFGLAMHAFVVLGGGRLRERMVGRELERIQRQSQRASR